MSGETTAEVTGRVIVITGAGQGIGRAYARHFADNGAIPVIADINGENGDKVAAEIEQARGRTLAVLSGANRVRAYDVKTGEEVWQCGGLGLNCVPVPVADGELIWVMSGWREAAGMAIRYAGAKGDLTDSDAVAWRLDVGLSYVPSPALRRQAVLPGALPGHALLLRSGHRQDALHQAAHRGDRQHLRR